jgi:hypothetical protein
LPKSTIGLSEIDAAGGDVTAAFGGRPQRTLIRVVSETGAAGGDVTVSWKERNGERKTLVDNFRKTHIPTRTHYLPARRKPQEKKQERLPLEMQDW